MTSQLDEKELYPPVSDYFMNQGYFVVSGSHKYDIVGTSEYGLLIEGQDMRVDIAAARWDADHQIQAVAVECKRVGQMSRSLGAGLWQATDYQVAFDKVFIATEVLGDAGNKTSVIKSLGVGHLGVDIARNACEVMVDSDFRNRNRFNESVWEKQVAPRLVMLLAFRDALGIPVRYGETFGGSGYIAKDMGGNVQYNCWFDKASRRSYFGINIEHINTFRRILKTTDWGQLQRQLKRLKTHRLMLTKDAVPGWRAAADTKLLGPVPCNEVKLTSLRKAIEDVINDRPRQWRPHLTISASLWTYDKALNRESSICKVNNAKEALSGVMSILTDLD